MDGNPSDIYLPDLRTNACNKVSSQYPTLSKTNPNEFLRLVAEAFVEERIKAFPQICEFARTQNLIKWKHLREYGNRGKYTETYGWSDDGEMKFQFEIPPDLYQFMQNVIFDGFWESFNKKIADKFMNRLCKGEDPERLLIWVRSQYGDHQGKVIYKGA